MTWELPQDEFIQFARIQRAAGLVPRIRGLVNGFLERAGITERVR